MGMFFNMDRVKQAKALMLHFHEDKKTRLKAAEYAVLRALAERMAQRTQKPKSKRMTPTIANTCFPSLKMIARDAAMSESTASRAIDKLFKRGLIDKKVIHNFTWKGRKDQSPQHNGMRYCITAIWDQVPVTEYNSDFDANDEEEREAPAPPTEEDMAEVDEALDVHEELPVAKKSASRTDATVSKAGVLEFYEQVIKCYFGGHKTLVTQSEEQARTSMYGPCQELLTLALNEGDLNYAHSFIWWVMQRRASEFSRLMDKVAKLGGPIGLRKTVADLWNEFIFDKNNEIEDGSANGESSDEQENYESEIDPEDYDDFGQQGNATDKAETEIHDFPDDEDDDIPSVESKPVAPDIAEEEDVAACRIDVLRQATQAAAVPPKPEPKFYPGYAVRDILRKMPVGSTEAVFTLPVGHEAETIEWLKSEFGADRMIDDNRASIAVHRANEFMNESEDRFFDPYAKERMMYDQLVSMVQGECKQSFARILDHFNLGTIEGIERETYKQWVESRYAGLVTVSDLVFSSTLIATKVTLRKGDNVLKFFDYLKDNPFVAPVEEAVAA